MQIEPLLKSFGLSEKEIAVYLALIEFGPAPVRVLAQKSKINRGTTYDILKSLIKLGLVSYFNKQSHQYFVAESPEKLVHALSEKQGQLETVKAEIRKNLPALKTIYDKSGGRPAVKLFEGQKGIRQIMQDVLDTMQQAEDKIYYVLSAASLRKNVYQAMPDFSQKRISKRIRVRTIALGEGGQLVGLDERKWIRPGTEDLKTATYDFVYSGKVAHISLDNAENPLAVLIENQAIYQTQKIVFESLWERI